MEVRQELRNQLHALSVFEAVPSVVARLELLLEILSQQLKALRSRNQRDDQDRRKMG